MYCKGAAARGEEPGRQVQCKLSVCEGCRDPNKRDHARGLVQIFGRLTFGK